MGKYIKIYDLSEAGFPTHYAGDQDRMATLRRIEEAVCRKKDNAEDRAATRLIIMRDNPDIFKNLYTDYQPSENRKKELDALVSVLADRISLEPKLTQRILSFDGKTLEERKALFQEIVNFLSLTAGVKPFQGGLPDKDIIVEKMGKGLCGSHLSTTRENGIETQQVHEIRVNQENLEGAKTTKELLNTLFHESLHATQGYGSNSFLELSHQYYVSTRNEFLKGNPEWKNGIYEAYQHQPVEAEAWYFGNRIGERFLDELKRAKEQNHILSVAKVVASVMTGEALADGKLEYGGQYAITFEKTMKGPFQQMKPEEVEEYFGCGARLSREGIRKSLVLPLGPMESSERFQKRVKEGASRLERDCKAREFFQKEVVRKIPGLEVIYNQEGNLTIKGNNPLLSKMFQDAGLNVDCRLTAKGDMAVHFPILLKQRDKKIDYQQAADLLKPRIGRVVVLSPNGQHIMTEYDSQGEPILSMRDRLFQSSDTGKPKKEIVDLIQKKAEDTR